MSQSLGVLESRQPISLKNFAKIKYKNGSLKVEINLEMKTK